MSPVKYELGFYIPEDGILHSHRRENPQILQRRVLVFHPEPPSRTKEEMSFPPKN
jgi:hypothetical protein